MLPDEHRESILDSHLVDADARSAMERDDYRAFLAARERVLISKIKELIS
ncbi:MAG: hypothetical protein M3R38_15610 [Actinomycetota bacterium]|nr:hypothetical protein [Actinomycetota bacterium]MDP9484835.1 hypothetical protein [Actinomycetota bacterium]